MKIAILTNQQFWNAPLGSASILRNRYRVFKKKYDVDVIYLHKQNSSVSPLKGFNIKIEDINEKTQIKFHEFIIKQKYKAIYCNYNFFWPLIYNLPNETKKILEMHDVIHLRTDSFAKYGYKAPITANKISEINQLKNYDHVISLSIAETSYLIKCGLNNVITIPPTIENVKKTLIPKTFTCGIIGSRATPNIDGVNLFFKFYKSDIPIITTGAIFNEIDKNQRYKFKNLGFLESLDLFFNQISVTAIPVRFGAGLKVKTFDSIVNCKPVFSTSHGIEGFPIGIKDISIVCDEPNQWNENNIKETTNIDQKKIFDYAKTNFEDICFAETWDKIFG